jgi:hypothetical protein
MACKRSDTANHTKNGQANEHEIGHEEGGDGPGGEEWKFLKFTNHNKTQQI